MFQAIGLLTLITWIADLLSPEVGKHWPVMLIVFKCVAVLIVLGDTVLAVVFVIGGHKVKIFLKDVIALSELPKSYNSKDENKTNHMKTPRYSVCIGMRFILKRFNQITNFDVILTQTSLNI